MTPRIEKSTDPHWAWAIYEPDTDRPWNLERVGHLYRRAGFGANWVELQQALSNGPQKTIDKLLHPQEDIKDFDRTLDEYENTSDSVFQLRAWWLRRMIQTPYPLQEKMTLFWHSHFATNTEKVKNARPMQQHIRLLRSESLGSFRILLEGISQDPAVLLWLGAEKNRKARPNKNFSRTLLQTFTLGSGNCTDKDIRETARAFTGWFVLRNKLRYIPREHDDGVKQILGHQGKFTNQDVLQMILNHPATSRNIVRRLYRWLISETEQPSDILIRPLVEAFAKHYDVSKLVETMLRSNLFFSTSAYRRRIKCPVEFALGIVKALEAIVSTTQLSGDLANLGQNLLYPPTVNGWIGGKYWIDSSGIIGRENLAWAMLCGSDPYGNKLNPYTVAKRHKHDKFDSAAQFIIHLFLQRDIGSDVFENLKQQAHNGEIDQRIRRFAHEVVTLPEFQLA